MSDGGSDGPSRDALATLRSRVERTGAPLCLGLDPHPEQLPAGLPRNVRGVETFVRGLIEAASDHAAAVKINLAFFEALGSQGIAVLERIRADLPHDLFLVLDGKRGDIGSTAERQAEQLFGLLAADAVTLSPYLGEDAIEPFLAYSGRFVYVLARTSNPNAGIIQDLPTGPEGMPLHEHVARWAAARWPADRVGLVVGATNASELRGLRAAVPALAFLVPGVGAQGGDLHAAVESCHGTTVPGLVNVSRGIASASGGQDWRSAAATAAEGLRNRMQQAGATLGR